MFTTSCVLVMTVIALVNAEGVGKAWEVSPVQSADPSSPLSSRPRLESSVFEVLSVSGVGRLAPSVLRRERYSTSTANSTSTHPTTTKTNEEQRAKEVEDLQDDKNNAPESNDSSVTMEKFIVGTEKNVEDVETLPGIWKSLRRLGRTGRKHDVHCADVEVMTPTSEKLSRTRRETETEMEKIAGTKNVREARLGSSESWSKQPLSVEFRRRSKLDEVPEDDDKLSRSTARGLQAPNVDFVTSNRRSFSESRESRDLPLPPTSINRRSYEETPIYRNTLRDRDLDVPYGRGFFYPERYRTERDYFVRSTSNEPNYPQDRYREIDFDLYGRNRPTMPKPKRIIYYATLPEVVRKPVDLRSYSRPHNAMTRSTNAPMSSDGFYKRRTAGNDPMKYRYYSYPHGNYENYDPYTKRQTWNERPYGPYVERVEDYRRREQDLDHASIKDNSRNEESMLELGRERKIPERAKMREHQEKLPWPVQIGTEVSVKENDRITGRKIFAQRDDFNRFRSNDRMDRERETSDSMETTA